MENIQNLQNLQNMTPEELAEHYCVTENTDDFESTGIGDEPELATTTDERGVKN